MNKFLPKFFLILLITFIFFLGVKTSLAASPSPAPSASPAGSAAPGAASGSTEIGTWVADPEVTFTGKIAARSADSLRWVIENYRWADFKQGGGTADERNPFNPIWITIRNIIYFILTLFILAGAFLIIVTRGESLSIKKFIPRFVIVLILVTMSFALIQFLYQITDLLQGFFLRRPGGGPNEFINSQDLLNVAFPYKEFQGFRRVGTDFAYQFDESAFIHLLLIKLTAATYYVMFIILILRKIILWFFIVVSPIFPLLIMFYPLKNSAKIWVGEFFRWLLYGPLFAVFLFGLVSIWQIYIPVGLKFEGVGDPTKTEYPTSINILLGGPGQQLSYDPAKGVENNLNKPDTFVQYVIALLMLWMVIIMPFILLKIFLDYLNSVDVHDNPLRRYLQNKMPPAPRSGDLSKILPNAKPYLDLKPPPIIPPTSTATGRAMEIPNLTAFDRDISTNKPQFRGNYHLQTDVKQVLDLSRLQIPTIKDISRFDSAVSTKSHTEETSKLMESLKRLSGESTIMSANEKTQFTELMEKLKMESQKGNPVAKGISEAAKKPEQAEIPDDNKVQTVNVEDYEEVKKTWMENYRNLEPADDPQGNPVPRVEWIKADIKQIPQVIDNLLSDDPTVQAQGKEQVSKILPFLLLGGFSKAEIVTYLKAKLEAAKQVESELIKDAADEENKVVVEAIKKEEPKSMVVEREIPEEEKNNLGEKPVSLYDQSSDGSSMQGSVTIGKEDYSDPGDNK